MIDWEKWKELEWKLFKFWISIPRILRISIIPLILVIISILGWVKIFSE
ncbi:hypothetical protein QCD85_14130 [Paenibacillus sp. PsM32]|nr:MULTISPECIES: hypothetical protein [unclassified Paenibacillus]MDN4619242.1 hypothetical protein [Paenibacillus sp. PsM32]WDF50579.1 hypothetical protein PQ460_21840 [Paenibacillus sp. KACC 21273]